MKLFPIAVDMWTEFNLFSHLALYDRKHFCSISTNLSSLSHSKWPFLFHQKFPLLSSDLKNSQNAFQKCSHLQMFFKTSVLINFPIFTRKYLFWNLFLIKLQAWWLATLLKKRPQHGCFPVNLTKFLRIAFLRNTSALWRLLLKMVEKFQRISNSPWK